MTAFSRSFIHTLNSGEMDFSVNIPRSPSEEQRDELIRYLQEIGQRPLLTTEQEQSLARRIQRGVAEQKHVQPDHQVIADGKLAQDQLVEANYRLVVSVARVDAQMATRGGANGSCVNGTHGSPFGQFAYCNAVNFFQATNTAIQAGKLAVPALGTANDGQACPSTRSFALVDMDQSDNVQTNYLVTANGQTAQFSAPNKTKLQDATVIGNPSDNALLTKFVDPALGCKPWTVPHLTNNNAPVATFGTDELMATADQELSKTDW